jgi:enoyl-[acyl-carrier protein] reductase I
MSGLLKGKKGIITGALDENSIAWQVALKCKAEGASIVLSNAPVALRMGKINELAEQTGAIVVGADATLTEDWEKLYATAMENLGGPMDFVLHSIGMSPNVRKGRAYTDLNYDWYLKSIDISAVSFHKMIQTAYKMDAMAEWGSILGLSYIAAQRTFPDYSDMAEAKAILEGIARSFGYHYGIKNKVRVNTISQSPTKTTAGTGVGGFDAFFDYADRMSPLGNASASACADYCISLFSDYTRMVTMQNLYHDGGFSSMGISADLMQQMNNLQTP